VFGIDENAHTQIHNKHTPERCGFDLQWPRFSRVQLENFILFKAPKTKGNFCMPATHKSHIVRENSNPSEEGSLVIGELQQTLGHWPLTSGHRQHASCTLIIMPNILLMDFSTLTCTVRNRQ